MPPFLFADSVKKELSDLRQLFCFDGVSNIIFLHIVKPEAGKTPAEYCSAVDEDII